MHEERNLEDRDVDPRPRRRCWRSRTKKALKQSTDDDPNDLGMYYIKSRLDWTIIVNSTHSMLEQARALGIA